MATADTIKEAIISVRFVQNSQRLMLLWHGCLEFCLIFYMYGHEINTKWLNVASVFNMFLSQFKYSTNVGQWMLAPYTYFVSTLQYHQQAMRQNLSRDFLLIFVGYFRPKYNLLIRHIALRQMVISWYSVGDDYEKKKTERRWRPHIWHDHRTPSRVKHNATPKLADDLIAKANAYRNLTYHIAWPEKYTYILI